MIGWLSSHPHPLVGSQWEWLVLQLANGCQAEAGQGRVLAGRFIVAKESDW